MRGAIFLLATCLMAYSVHSENYDDEFNFRRRPSVDIDMMIVNGEDATWGQFPWQLSFELPTYDIDGSDGHFCGASLLSDRWAITAAHCVIFPPFANRLLGNVITRSTDRLTTGILTNLTVHYVHESYDPDSVNITYENDIALLEFAEPLEGFDVQFTPINLPRATDNFEGAECRISGWGTSRSPFQLPQDTLQYTETTTISYDECDAMVGGDVGAVLGPGHICVFNGESGACSGDSGGPLSCKDEWGNWVLAGVTSWGVIGLVDNRTACLVDYPTAYTRVSHYLDWIYQTTDGALGSPTKLY